MGAQRLARGTAIGAAGAGEVSMAPRRNGLGLWGYALCPGLLRQVVPKRAVLDAGGSPPVGHEGWFTDTPPDLAYGASTSRVKPVALRAAIAEADRTTGGLTAATQCRFVRNQDLFPEDVLPEPLPWSKPAPGRSTPHGRHRA